METRGSWNDRCLLRPSNVLVLILVLLLSGLWPQPVAALDGNGNGTVPEGQTRKSVNLTESGVRADRIPTQNLSRVNESDGSNSNVTATPISILAEINYDNGSHSGNTSNSSNIVANITTTTPQSGISTANETVSTAQVNLTLTNGTAVDEMTSTSVSSPAGVSAETDLMSTIVSPESAATLSIPTSIKEKLVYLSTMCQNRFQRDNRFNNTTMAAELTFNLTTLELAVDLVASPTINVTDITTFIEIGNQVFDLNITYAIGNSTVRLRGTSPRLGHVFKQSWSLNLEPVIRQLSKSDGLKVLCDAGKFDDFTSTTASFSVSSTQPPTLAPIGNPFEKKARNALAFVLAFTFAIFICVGLMISCGKCSNASAPSNWTSWSGIATNVAIYKSNARAWFRDLRSGRSRPPAARYSAHRDAEAGLLEQSYELL